MRLDRGGPRDLAAIRAGLAGVDQSTTAAAVPGVADFFSLLDAERERLAAQDRSIQLQVARANALLAVHQAFAARLLP